MCMLCNIIKDNTRVYFKKKFKLIYFQIELLNHWLNRLLI